jgi:vancomycin permeability regulator SanA
MIIRTAILLALLIPLLMSIPRLVTALHARQRIYKAAQTPEKRIAIVFGAGLWRDGRPTPVLRDRVETAADLYFTGRVEKLLMSGDNRFVDYNEPAAMRAYAIELGVPDDAIVLDYAGRRTYDTCYRARDIFAVREAILVTQAFHLPRAVYTCNKLGLPAIGVKADNRVYRRRHLLYWNVREIIATSVALWEVHISRPIPVLGNPEPIFPLEAQ